MKNIDSKNNFCFLWKTKELIHYYYILSSSAQTAYVQIWNCHVKYILQTTMLYKNYLSIWAILQNQYWDKGFLHMNTNIAHYYYFIEKSEAYWEILYQIVNWFFYSYYVLHYLSDFMEVIVKIKIDRLLYMIPIAQSTKEKLNWVFSKIF